MAMIPEYDEDEFHFDELPTTSAAVEQNAAAPVAAAPAPIVPRAPVPAVATAPVEADPYASKIALREKQLENAMNFSANEKDPAKLFNAAPAWFKGGPPPEKNVWGNALTGMAGGMMTKPLELALSNPNRTFGNKLQDAKQLAAVQGMEGLISGLINRRSDNYDRNLDAAAKEASMLRTLPGGSRGSKLVDSAKTLYEGALREQGMADTRKLREHNMAVADMMNSTDEQAVPQLKAARDVVAQIRESRGLPPIDLSGTSLASLQKNYGMFNSEMGAESREAVADASAQNARSRIAAQGNEQRKTAAEHITQEDARLRAEFQDVGDPDFVMTGAVPQDASAREKLRAAVSNRKTMLDELSKLKAIQHELNTMKRGNLGPFDQWLGSLVGGDSEKAQKLVTEGKAIQNDLTVKERERANMGVPQPWEHALAKSLYPAPGDPTAWLNENMWDSMGHMLDTHFYNFIKAHGGGLKSHGHEGVAPYVAQPNLSEVAPVVSARTRNHGAPLDGAGGDDLTLPPQVEAAVQAHEVPVPPIPKDALKGQTKPKNVKSTGEVVPTPAPAAAAPSASDPKRERMQAIIKQLEGRQLTPEQKAKLEALKAQVNAP